MKLRNRILGLLSILFLLGIFTSTHAAAADIITPFVDVTNTDWFFEPVMWAVQNSVTGGTSATTFSPDRTCTRGQIVTFLYKASIPS